MDIMRPFRDRWARTAAAALLGGGVVALILGYVGASGTPYTAEQLPYIASGAVGGIFLLGLAATLFLSADLHDEWKKLDAIERLLQDGPGSATPDSYPEPITASMRSIDASDHDPLAGEEAGHRQAMSNAGPRTVTS
jgi:hypothetical protein